MPIDAITHGALVCTTCVTCFRYHNGVLEFLKSRPDGLTRAQRTNFSPWIYGNYQKRWRTWIMSALTAERFSNTREHEWLEQMVSQYIHGDVLPVDIGTAHGFYALSVAAALKAAEKSQFVIAIDFSLGMLTEAVRAAEQLNLQDRILFILADVENLPLRDDVSGMVTCGGGLNEYAHVATALEEVRRIMTPDGRFVAMHLHKGKGVLALLQDFIHHTCGLRFPEHDEWSQLFEQASLRHRPNLRKGVVSWTTLTQ